MSADVKWLQPFKKGDTGALRAVPNNSLERSKPLADSFQQRLGGPSTPGLFADPQNIAPYIAKVLRIEAQHLWALGEAHQRRSQIIRRGGTYVTQILRDDQIGSELFQGLRVDGVETFTSGDIFADEAVDLQRRRAFGNTRLNDHSFVTSLRRKITFVTDADDFSVEAQRKQNLRGRGQQRNDSHGQNVSHAIAEKRKKLKRVRLSRLHTRPPLRPFRLPLQPSTIFSGAAPACSSRIVSVLPTRNMSFAGSNLSG